MGGLFSPPDRGPDPAQIAQQERADKIGQLKSARDLRRIQTQRSGLLSLLNPGLKIPGQSGGSGGSSSGGL